MSRPCSAGLEQTKGQPGNEALGLLGGGLGGGLACFALGAGQPPHGVPVVRWPIRQAGEHGQGQTRGENEHHQGEALLEVTDRESQHASHDEDDGVDLLREVLALEVHRGGPRWARSRISRMVQEYDWLDDELAHPWEKCVRAMSGGISTKVAVSIRDEGI